MPPNVPTFFHRDFCIRPIEHNTGFNRWRFFQRFIYDIFECEYFATSITTVSCKLYFGTGIIVTIRNRLSGKPRENHTMNCANPSTGQHSKSEFRNHRHVNRNDISLLHTGFFKRIGQPTHFTMKFSVSKRTHIARLTFPDNGCLVRIFCQIPIKAIVRDIRLSTDEPLRIWLFPFQCFIKCFEPMKILLGQITPELNWISRRLVI